MMNPPKATAARLPRLGIASKASFWTLLSFGGSQVMRLGGNIVLARLMFPEAFGLMALVAVFMSGLQMFSDIGIIPALIRSQRGEDPAFRNTAWTLGLIRGGVLWAAAAALALPASLLYDPQLLALLPVTGANALLASLGSTSTAVLRRRADLRDVTIQELIALGLGMSLTIAWALYSPSVWAFVAGGLLTSAARSALSWRLLPEHRDRWSLDRPAVRELMTFGRWIFLSTIITFFAMQADRLLLGRLIPLELLGIYSIALSLIVMPRELISRLAGAVQYPLLSRCVRETPQRLDEVLRKTRSPLLLMLMWSTLAIALGSQAFFALLYDERYVGAVRMVQILSVSALISALSLTVDRALLALGDSRALASTNLAKAISVVPVCLLGHMWWGVDGFMVGLAISAAIGHLALAMAMRRHHLHFLGQDVRYMLAFMALLAAPILLARHAVTLGTFHQIDLGLLACSAAVLGPLGVVAIKRTKGLLRS